MVTGENQPSGDTFITTAGGNPILEGPVFTHDVNRISFRDTTIKNGSLWYTDTACSGEPASGDKLAFKDSDIDVANLTFDPPTRKIYCLNLGWKELFEFTPPEAHVGSIGPPTTPPTTHGSCTVFSPGRYSPSNPLVLGSDNYFRNGTYVFENLGEISLSHTRVTFGTTRPEEDPLYPLLELNSSCEEVRQQEIQQLESNPGEDSGATLYLSGNSRFLINVQSHVEIAGRQQGEFIVAMHALTESGGANSTPSHVLRTGSGNNKESAFSGLVWAPRSKVEVGTVAAKKEAAFRGGIVIGAFEGTISAAPSGGFLIRVPTSQASVKLLLEANAVDDRGTTTVRVVADYRPSRGDVAVNSWRVCPPSGC